MKALGIQGSGGQRGAAGREGKSNKARPQSKCKADPEPSREFQGRVHVGRREQENTGAYADPSGPLKPPHPGPRHRDSAVAAAGVQGHSLVLTCLTYLPIHSSASSSVKRETSSKRPFQSF